MSILIAAAVGLAVGTTDTLSAVSDGLAVGLMFVAGALYPLRRWPK